MQVPPDKVEHVFGTLCSRGCTLDDEGNPKPTWGLAVAREATASREARVATIFSAQNPSTVKDWCCLADLN
jgi:hypothetical protein